MINIFNDALLTTRKFHSLTEIYVSWILLTGFLIWKSIFNFWKICDEEKVWLASNELDDEEKEWWEDIQIDRKRRGKHPIHS